LSDLSATAAAPEIDKGPSVPVKVIPVLDMDTPLLKLGGKRDRMKLPDRWVRQTPKPRVEQKAFVSPDAGKTEEDIPPPEVKVADAGTAPPPPDAEVARQVDIELDPKTDAGEAPNVDQEGHADGVKEGTETDPLKARAVDLYLARIAGWFSSRFRVSGSGLPPEELTKHRPRAVIVLSDGQMVSYTLTPSGNPVFDAAAQATLEGAKGQALPPPPENYPDLGQKQVSVTFVCRENTCD
ncbi:energy transducer TonB, partial [Sorangium cellulosum]